MVINIQHFPSEAALFQSKQSEIFLLQDGRQLSYDAAGPPNGKPIFYFHGSPGSRLESLPLTQTTVARHYRIIAPERPGMGHSSFNPGYTLLDYTQDILELADALGFKTFGVMGHSGGGVTALCCAYAIPERLDFVFDLAGWAPMTVPALKAQITAIDRFFAERCIPQLAPDKPNKVPTLFQFPFTLLGFAAKALPPATFVKVLYQSKYFCDEDYAMLSNPDAANFLIGSVRESFVQGSEGAAYDALLRYQDWGFELSEIDCLVHIFHGDRDISAPYHFAEYKHRHLPNSKLHTYPGEGHFFLWSHWEDIFRMIETG
ncbi:MAG: alpha/beta hydrolase [Cyanobacteria bacterium J06650_10]